MNVEITPKESQTLLAFLKDTTYVQMPKKAHAALARFRDDVRSREINSQRLEHVYPTLRAAHDLFRGMANKTLRYSTLPRWARALVLPAVVMFFFKVLPASRRYHRDLDNVAQLMVSIRERAHGLEVR